MLWFGKRAKEAGSVDRDLIEPADLAVEFDGAVAEGKLDSLLKEFDERGGPESFLTALRLKHELFRKALPEQGPAQLSREAFETLLSSVFPARRKLAEKFAAMSEDRINEAINDLVYGEADLQERMQAFCELVPKEEKKPRRAIWDLAAELLHFREPEAIPLMTRWVWDSNTASGALREFIRGNDSLPEIPLDTAPGTFEAARNWFADVLGQRGFYRDIPFLIDMLQAQAYADYVKAMSTGIGMVDAEYGGRQDPLEFLLKLLGIDVRAKDMKEARSGDNEPTLH